MKKIFGLLLGFMLVGSILLGCSNSDPIAETSESPSAPNKTEEENVTDANVTEENVTDESVTGNGKIKIGVIMPMTGGAASYGEEAKKAVLYLQDEVNQEGINGSQIEFIVEDDVGTPATAVTAAEKLVKIDKVSAIVGPLFASNILAIKDITTEAEIPLITPTANAAELFTDGGYIFSIDVLPNYEMKLYADYIYNVLGKENVATYSVYSDATVSSLGFFKKYFEEYGGAIIAQETFNQGEDDHSTELTKLKAAAPEVLVIYADTEDGTKIVRKMKELDFTVQIVSDHQMVQSAFLENVGAVVDGNLSYVVTDQVTNKDALELKAAFGEGYSAKYGEEPGNVASLVYDCCKIVLSGIEKAGAESGPALREAMAQTDLMGVTGPVQMTNNGTTTRTGIMIEYANGESTPLDLTVDYD